MAHVVLRTKQYVCTLRPHERVLVLATMLYADEIRAASDLEAPAITTNTASRRIPREGPRADSAQGQGGEPAAAQGATNNAVGDSPERRARRHPEELAKSGGEWGAPVLTAACGAKGPSTPARCTQADGRADQRSRAGAWAAAPSARAAARSAASAAWRDCSARPAAASAWLRAKVARSAAAWACACARAASAASRR